MALCIIPTAPMHIRALVMSRVLMAMLKPFPSVPIIAEAGTLTSSITTSAVFDVRIPILFSSFPELKPGVPFSTKNVLIPFTPFSLSVMAVII